MTSDMSTCIWSYNSYWTKKHQRHMPKVFVQVPKERVCHVDSKITSQDTEIALLPPIKQHDNS